MVANSKTAECAVCLNDIIWHASTKGCQSVISPTMKNLIQYSIMNTYKSKTPEKPWKQWDSFAFLEWHTGSIQKTHQTTIPIEQCTPVISVQVQPCSVVCGRRLPMTMRDSLWSFPSRDIQIILTEYQSRIGHHCHFDESSMAPSFTSRFALLFACMWRLHWCSLNGEQILTFFRSCREHNFFVFSIAFFHLCCIPSSCFLKAILTFSLLFHFDRISGFVISCVVVIMFAINSCRHNWHHHSHHCFCFHPHELSDSHLW